MRQPLFDVRFTPAEIFFGGRSFLPFERFGKGEQAIGRVRTSIQQHVFHTLEQVFGDFLVDRQLSGVDDSHVHARVHRVIEERRVHRFADHVVAAEGEGDVADAAGDLRSWTALLDPSRGLDEIHGVVVVLGDARSRRSGCWDQR